MGFLDDVTKRVKTLVTEREGQIRSAKDKAGKFVDDKTGGKYHDKIAKASEQADKGIDKAVDKSKQPPHDGPVGDGPSASPPAQ